MTIQTPISAGIVFSEAIPIRVVGLSERRAAIFFDARSLDLRPGERLMALSDGRPLDGPLAVTRLARQDGGERHVMLIARAADCLCRSRVRIIASGRDVARIDPVALQSPLADPMALIAGLGEAGRRRLLKLMLTTAASLFGKGDLGGFGTVVGQLVESLGGPIPLIACSPVGREAMILSWRLPPDLTLPPLRDLCILHEGRARRFTRFVSLEEPLDQARLLHVLMDARPPEAAELLALGPQPIRLSGPTARSARTTASWIDRRPQAIRAAVLDWLARLGEQDAQVAALRHELACPSWAEPAVEVLHLSHTPAGLLYLVSVSDPTDLVASIRLTVGGASLDLDCDRLEWHATKGTVVAGFAPLAPCPDEAVGVAPVYRSGRVATSLSIEPVPFRGDVPEAFAGLPDGLVTRALSHALPATIAKRPAWRRRVAEFGPPLAPPRTALVIAAGPAPDSLRAVVTALVAEPSGRSVEIVVHHADGPATQMVLQTAQALAAIHGVPVRIVSVAPEATASERLRAALSKIQAPVALTLGADCVPSGRGWLVRWRRQTATLPGAAVTLLSVTPAAGAVPGLGEAVGLNAAALARLRAAPPRLTGAAADIAAMPGLRRSAIRSVGATSYGITGCPLVAAAERQAAERLRDGSHG